MKTNGKDNIYQQRIYGKKSILDALNSKSELLEIIYSQKSKEIGEYAKSLGYRTKLVDDHYFDKYKTIKLNHQYCEATLKQVKIISLQTLISDSKKKDNPIIVMLDEINDPQNYGAILRTCAAADVSGVIVKNRNQSPLNDVALKSSLGAIRCLPIVIVNNLRNAIDVLRKEGYWIVSSSLKDNSVEYTRLIYDRPYVLIVGNEANGVSQILEKESDYLVKIPMSNNIQSLNVNAATAILLFWLLANKK